MSKRALQAQDRCGPFRVERFVESIRTTEHYEVVHEADGEKGALWILTRDAAGDERERRRFEAETALLAEIDHPNIVRSLASGEHEGLPWRVTEHVVGGSLRARLDAAPGPIPTAVALCFARQIADALEALHAAGAAHGELSAQSLLLTEIDEVKLTDLGWAPLTRGEPLDASADVLAAGAVLRAMVEGKGGARAQRRFPDPFMAIVERATAPDPEERYSSMAALGDAVNEAWNELLDHSRGGTNLEQAISSLAQALGRGGEEEGTDPSAADELEELLQKLVSAVKTAEKGP
jgi:tRNA A-37 threonylcarbamoyl transferase component Bud32